ncbi:MAG TPA: hypothetical protein VG936_12485 [Lacunisphaera sp.]|nr:hypothetical protein [Lacunisphaera sp.]
MIKRINHTGRKRILREHVQVAFRDDGGHPSFDAALDLSSYQLPGTARVFVEAYRGAASWMRFDFGTKAALRPPSNRRLAEFSDATGVRFRVKVTSAEESHKILAEADAIPLTMPGDDEQKYVPLLKPEPASLGDLVYKVCFDGPEPTFQVNDRISNWQEAVLHPSFVAITYASVFREILTKIVLIDGHSDCEDRDDWRSRWLVFSTMLPGVASPPDQQDDEDEKRRWIDDAVDAFARKVRALELFEGVRTGQGGAQ